MRRAAMRRGGEAEHLGGKSVRAQRLDQLRRRRLAQLARQDARRADEQLRFAEANLERAGDRDGCSIACPAARGHRGDPRTRNHRFMFASRRRAYHNISVGGPFQPFNHSQPIR
jgi:hypothetical protein